MTSEIADRLMEASAKTSIPLTSRESESILQALRTGVVPKVGLRHLHVGRSRELAEMVKDIGRIADGGASLRFIIGEYGSGKTFFLSLIRQIALDHGLVVTSADLTPSRRVHGTTGEARALMQELTKNLATRLKPEGGALASIIERFIVAALSEERLATSSDDQAIQRRLEPLEELVSGFDFAGAVVRYARACGNGDEGCKSAALRWLRAEYVNGADARSALAMRNTIDDSGAYDHLKVLARFVKLAGYGGLLVVLDEMVNLHKLVNSQARNANYEQLLHIVNDVLQGAATDIGFVMGGTPEFLEDARRGLYSYPALASRLAENRFAQQQLVDFSGPVIRLQKLAPEELLALLGNIRHVFTSSGLARCALPDEALIAFLEHCSRKIGDSYFRTPRNTVTAFVNMLSLLAQNPSTGWRDLIGTVDISPDRIEYPTGGVARQQHDAEPALDRDEELAHFRL
jgi:hypothetical protein